ncbi:MAG: hypothetical protein GVY16_11055 [Planctomycetes bacterium]|jgi:hypothetical protein|nr:hypothetical protein [Planctomycetota bacterium]
MKDNDRQLSRRGLFRWAARGAAGAAGAALVVLLGRRGQLRATRAECIGSGRCKGCDALDHCKLPQGVFMRRARETQQEPDHG